MKINLRLSVNILDAQNIIKWLENEDVTKYLNEDVQETMSLKEIIESNRADLLTYYLNRDGRFFLIDLVKNKSIGFITLFTIRPMKEYEIVIAIGNPKNWGKKYGYYALKHTLYEAFINWRIEKLVAKIHVENSRSIRLFEHLEFKNLGVKKQYIIFSLSFDEYLASLSTH